MIKDGNFKLGTSRSDLDMSKKAEYEDEDSYIVVDSANRKKLAAPKKIEGCACPDDKTKKE